MIQSTDKSLFLILALFIILGFSLRDILQKHTAPHYAHHYEAGGIPAIFTCSLILIFAFFLKPLWLTDDVSYVIWKPFWYMISSPNQSNIILVWAIIVGIIKGIIVFMFNSGARNLDLSSVSGSTYLAFISVGIGSIINYLIFNEHTQIMPIFIIFIAALIFYLAGPGKKLREDKKSKTLLFCIIGLASLICLDYVGIRASNWFFHLSISNGFALLLFVIITILHKAHNFKHLLNPLILLSGLIYAGMEFLFVFSFSVLGVSYAFLFGMLSYLPTMLIGSIKYGEGKWYVQASFALIAILCIYQLAFN